MNVREFIKEIINIGEGVEKEIEFKRNEVMEIIHSNDFYILLKKLNKEDFIKLIKGVCILESLPDMQFGSTTRIPKILNTFTHKDDEDRIEIIDWLFKNRINPYIPFGLDIPLEIKSEKEYIEYEESRALHRRVMLEQDERRHQEAIERKRKNFEEHRVRSEANRKKYYENIKNLEK